MLGVCQPIKMDSSLHSGVKFAKASVVPVDTGDFNEGADKSVRVSCLNDLNGGNWCNPKRSIIWCFVGDNFTNASSDSAGKG